MIRRCISIFTVLFLLTGMIPTFTSADTLTNLALNKSVTTGQGYCNGSETAAQAVDGSAGTKWCHQNSGDWLRVDLGATYNVSEFILTNNNENSNYITRDYNIQTSMDGITWSSAVVNVTNNTTLVVTSVITPVMARYVKLDVTAPVQSGSGHIRINEFAVNGDPIALVNAETPSIGTQPIAATVNEGDSSPTLSVSASVSDSGTLSYQWYSNTTNSSSSGSAISGATSSSYSAPTNAAGTIYYYILVTNTNSGATGVQTASATSSVAQVTVAPIPTGSFIIEGGATVINTATVSLAITRSGTYVNKMRFTDDVETWLGWENYSPTKTYTMLSGDGLKTIFMQLQDTSSGNVSVTYSDSITLDMTVPVITLGSYDGTTPTNDDITVSATTNEGTLNAASHTFTNNGTFSFMATDAAGNATTQTVTITNIDKIAPVITLGSYDGTTPTNDDITVSATTNEGTLNAASHTFTNNGTFNFTATDAVGNVTIQTVTITNIDKIAPATADAITINSSTKYVTINLSAVDNGTDVVTSYYTVDGVQQTGKLIFLNKQGAHLITYWSVDAAGNIETVNSKEVKVEILQIDSNGKFEMDDIINLMQNGTLVQQDMNGDGIFEREDLLIMLGAITPISF
jgi:hypothetical protein